MGPGRASGEGNGGRTPPAGRPGKRGAGQAQLGSRPVRPPGRELLGVLDAPVLSRLGGRSGGPPRLGVPPAFPFHMIKLPPRPRGHQLAPWQSSPRLEWAPGTPLYFQEVVRTWAEGGGWLLCRAIDSERRRGVPPDGAPTRTRGMPEVGALRKWRLRACPEPRSPIPGSPVWVSSPLPTSATHEPRGGAEPEEQQGSRGADDCHSN